MRRRPSRRPSRRPWRRAAAAVLLGVGGPWTLGAQEQPVRRPPVEAPRDTAARDTAVRQPPLDSAGRAAARDSIRRAAARDSIRRAVADSAGRPRLIHWVPDDSVMLALLQRAGYRVVRYQSDSIGFDAGSRTMSLAATDSGRSGVQRDSTLLVARRIVYNDSTQMIAARGDTIVMRDPDQVADVIGREEMTYDLARREGRTRQFSTIANSGEDWQILAHRATFTSDSTSDRSTVYGRDGIITSCLDSVPHYHFLAKELKRVSRSVIIARPAILYVGQVPVLWLPFMFQDIRTGRRSGLLTPRLGFSELVRNSPTYRRTAENLGYYFALSDYVDAQVSLDWRSSARETAPDPGWTRLNGEFRYRWLDRFVGGQVAVSRNALSNGTRNLGVAWSHTQEFSSRTRLSTNLNYVTNTHVQRQAIINPMAALATIASQANLVRQQGPFTVNLGGSRRQYPGRDQVDQDFPSLNVASKPLTVGDWFVLTPTFALRNTEAFNLDAAGDFVWRYGTGPGGLDSTRLKRDTRNSAITLSTPFKFFNFQVQNSYRYTDVVQDFPAIKTVPDPADPSRTIDRVYARTYLSTADFDVSVGLPQFAQGRWNVAPYVSLSNVDPSGSFVRSERTNGAWVSQSKRVTYGLGISPTLFRLLPGIGPAERMRHSVSPTLSWGYSPAKDVSDEYLLALGKSPASYIGGLAQNRVTFGLNTSLEAKLRIPDDTARGGGRKVRLVSLQFTPLVYDFEKKRQIGGSGFATDRAGYTFRSELLPGFDLGVDYSLFQGSVLTDTAVFKPYREAVRFGFDLNRNSAIVRGIVRLLGLQPVATVAAEGPGANETDAMGGGLVSSMIPGQQGIGAVTGTRGRSGVQELNTARGFTANFSVSQQRQRPPVGGRVIDYDPAVECAALAGLPQYDFCIFNAERNRPTDGGQGDGTAGGTFIRVPPTTSVGIRTSFNLTPKWGAGWNTTYDVERSQFASQVVTLQRDLHDWKAIFGVTQAPNGNFSFTFLISLKAQPEIKMDYDRRTYRQPTAVLP
ncbi:MAG: putative LPS assembly protein LptD [Gemmatimonadaceae bacterium]